MKRTIYENDVIEAINCQIKHYPDLAHYYTKLKYIIGLINPAYEGTDGEWYDDHWKNSNWASTCSRCGEELIMPSYGKYYSYCAACGARMKNKS